MVKLFLFRCKGKLYFKLKQFSMQEKYFELSIVEIECTNYGEINKYIQSSRFRRWPNYMAREPLMWINTFKYGSLLFL